MRSGSVDRSSPVYAGAPTGDWVDWPVSRSSKRITNRPAAAMRSQNSGSHQSIDEVAPPISRTAGSSSFAERVDAELGVTDRDHGEGHGSTLGVSTSRRPACRTRPHRPSRSGPGCSPGPSGSGSRRCPPSSGPAEDIFEPGSACGMP